MNTKSTLKSVDLLRNEDIGNEDIDRVKEARKFTLRSLQKATSKQLSKIRGLSAAKIQRIKSAADKLSANCDVLCGSQIMEESFIISTGVRSVDELLSGGIKSMQITEVFGSNDEVMKLLSHTLCVTSQFITNTDFCEGKAVFIDTNGGYRKDYIEIIAKTMGIQNPNRAILNVSYYRVNGKEQLLELLDEFPKLFYEAKGCYNFFVIDSFSALFSSKKEKKIKEEILLKLQRLSEEYNFAVLVTNAKVMKEITSIKPPMVRLAIENAGLNWEAQLQSDLLTYENGAQFAVSNSGLCDIPPQ